MKKQNNFFLSLNKINKLLLIIFISIILISNTTCRDLYSSSNWTELPSSSAKDIGSNGDNTWFCSQTGQIVKVNNDITKRTKKLEADVEGELPTCKRIEANFDGSVFVIDDNNSLKKLTPSNIEFYATTTIAEKVEDVGCNTFGDCFYISNKELFKIGSTNIKYYTFPVVVERLDVGLNQNGKEVIVCVTDDKKVFKLEFTKLPKDKTLAEVDYVFLDIYATDVTFGTDNRIYAATTDYGTFVYNESSAWGYGHDFDRVAPFGRSISAGYDIYVLTANNRIVRSPLMPRTY